LRNICHNFKGPAHACERLAQDRRPEMWRPEVIKPATCWSQVHFSSHYSPHHIIRWRQDERLNYGVSFVSWRPMEMSTVKRL